MVTLVIFFDFKNGFLKINVDSIERGERIPLGATDVKVVV
jgi:hypothetical protein